MAVYVTAVIAQASFMWVGGLVDRKIGPRYTLLLGGYIYVAGNGRLPFCHGATIANSMSKPTGVMLAAFGTLPCSHGIVIVTSTHHFLT